MLIQGALVHAKEVSTDEFLEFMARNIPEGDFFKFQPPHGIILNEVFDWRAILENAAAIATLAPVLWCAYDRFIRPIKKNNQKSDAAIFVQLKNEYGTSDQFMIGKDVKDKEILIHRIHELQIKDQKNSPDQEIPEITTIKRSEYWVKVRIK